MSRYIALLRAINAGPKHAVKMEVLRKVFRSLHFSEVDTYIGSGNIVFKTSPKNAKTLEKRIEKGLRRALGQEVATFVRKDEELAEIANSRQFRLAESDGRTSTLSF